MRDDVAPPNLGQCDRLFNAEFFWKTYRTMEQQWTRVLSKGPLSVSQLVADDISADTMSLGGQPVATKPYVDAADANKVAKAGDTMTGFLQLNADPTSSLHATTKNYVDTADNSLNANKVAKAGDTMTGTLTVTNVQFPASPVLSADPNNMDEYKEGSFTSTVTASTGTLTTAAGTVTYVKIGRLVTFNANITVTTNGTGAGTLRFTVPHTATIGSFSGRENSLTGKSLNGVVNGNLASVFYYDNTYCGGSGVSLAIHGCYQI